jgi:hypothetical protein
LILSPLIGLIVVGVSEDLSAQQKLKSGQLKKCPACAESVLAEAKVCRYCHFEFAQPPPETPEEKAKRLQEEKVRSEAAARAWEVQRKKDRKVTAIALTLVVVMTAVAVFYVSTLKKTQAVATSQPIDPAEVTRGLTVGEQPRAPKASDRSRSGIQKSKQEEFRLEPQRWVRLRYPSGSTPWFVLDGMVSDEEWRALSVGDTVAPSKVSSSQDTWTFKSHQFSGTGVPIGVIIEKVDTVGRVRK